MIELQTGLKTHYSERRAAHGVMLHAESAKELELIVIAAQRKFNRQFPERNREEAAHLRMQPQPVSGYVEVVPDR